jgi:hypothetical protein
MCHVVPARVLKQAAQGCAAQGCAAMLCEEAVHAGKHVYAQSLACVVTTCMQAGLHPHVHALCLRVPSMAALGRCTCLTQHCGFMLVVGLLSVVVG